MSPAETMIAPLYDALTEPATKDVVGLLAACLAPDWLSLGSAGTNADRAHFIAKVEGFGAAIPDLRFAVQEVIAAGDRIVVRSEATGTPAGPFMGVPHGGRTFRIMTIDIHTVSRGRIQSSHHVEDWLAAIAQLRG